MPELIALKAMRYRRRAIRPGDRFSVGTPIEAFMMQQMGNAAPPPVEPEPAAHKPKRKAGSYKRRDMRAEE